MRASEDDIVSNATLLIADLAGPGSVDDLDGWARDIERSWSGEPGVTRVARYRKFNDGRAIVVAELDDGDIEGLRRKVKQRPAPHTLDVLSATELRAHKRKDAPADPRELPFLYTVAFPVPREREADLAAWYDDEHLPMLLGCPYWVASRRFRVADGAPERWRSHLTLHYFSDPQALRSPERDSSRVTDWRNRLAREPWFRGTYTLYLQEWPATKRLG